MPETPVLHHEIKKQGELPKDVLQKTAKNFYTEITARFQNPFRTKGWKKDIYRPGFISGEYPLVHTEQDQSGRLRTRHIVNYNKAEPYKQQIEITTEQVDKEGRVTSLKIRQVNNTGTVMLIRWGSTDTENQNRFIWRDENNEAAVDAFAKAISQLP